ncbi:MAG: response regulator [Leptospiraceae bacterium]|nr:response regulator [Leptospiraceae bacterium]
MLKPEILIIDDSQEIGEALSIILESLGYSTRYFSYPIEAVSYFESELNPVIFLDINLPGKSGLELLPMLKKINPKTQIIMITGERDINSLISSISNRASDFLLKPFNIDAVEIALNRVMEYYELLKERENYQEALERDIKFGSRIQRQIIYPSKQEKGLFIDFHPISYLSGHFHNIVEIDKNKKSVIYGNVEGSGVASGFIGLYSISVAKDVIKNSDDPTDILTSLNKELYFKLNIHTLTMLGILIDYEKEEISYSIGGLPEPILFSSLEETPVIFSLDTVIILGVVPDATFKKTVVPFKKGDILFIFNNAFFNSRKPELKENFEDLKTTLANIFKSSSNEKFKEMSEVIRKFLEVSKNKNLISRDLSFILYEL